ncbi:hypothetical protein HK104_010513 [Borealophlyctis nickersoniae]|nr:hypothetical protein HK104_010513 [Borealophlyctis nickersoniae]
METESREHRRGFGCFLVVHSTIPMKDATRRSHRVVAALFTAKVPSIQHNTRSCSLQAAQLYSTSAPVDFRPPSAQCSCTRSVLPPTGALRHYLARRGSKSSSAAKPSGKPPTFAVSSPPTPRPSYLATLDYPRARKSAANTLAPTATTYGLNKEDPLATVRAFHRAAYSPTKPYIALRLFQEIANDLSLLQQIAPKCWRLFLALMKSHVNLGSNRKQVLRHALRRMWAAGCPWELEEYKMYLWAGVDGERRLSLALAKKFLKGMKEHGVEPDAELMGDIVRKIGAGSLDEAIVFWEELAEGWEQMDETVYAKMVEVYVIWGKFNEAERLKVEMEKAGHRRGNMVHAALIRGYGRRGQIKSALRVFDELVSSKYPLDTTVYANLIFAHALSGSLSSAITTFRSMPSAGIAPDQITYEAVIHGCLQHGKPREAGQWFESMVAAGITPSITVYSLLIGWHIRSGNRMAADRLFKDMKARKVKRDPRFYAIMVHSYLRAQDMDNALKAVRLAVKNEMDTDPAFAVSLLDGLLKSGLTQEMAAKFLSKYHFPVNNIVCAVLIAASIRNGDLDTAKRLFKKLREAHVTPNAILLSILAHVHIRAGDVDLAMQVLEAMQADPKSRRHPRDRIFRLPNDSQEHNLPGGFSNRVSPYLVASSTVVSGLCRLALPARAFQVLEKVVDEGYRPHPLLYGGLLKHYSGKKDLNTCLELLSSMLNRYGGWLDIAGLRTVYRGHMKVFGAWSTYREEMAMDDDDGNEVVVRDEAGRGNEIERAPSCRQQTEEGERPPQTPRVFAEPRSFHECLHAESSKRFLLGLKTIAQLPASPVFYAAMIEEHAEFNEMGDAEHVFLEMQGEGMELDQETCTVLADMYGRLGEHDKAAALKVEAQGLKGRGKAAWSVDELAVDHRTNLRTNTTMIRSEEVEHDGKMRDDADLEEGSWDGEMSSSRWIFDAFGTGGGVWEEGGKEAQKDPMGIAGYLQALQLRREVERRPRRGGAGGGALSEVERSYFEGFGDGV